MSIGRQMGTPATRAITVTVVAMLIAVLSFGITGVSARGDTSPTTVLSLSSNPSKVADGGKIKLSGILGNKGGPGLGSKRVILEQKAAGAPDADFVPVSGQPLEGVLTGRNGAFSLSAIQPQGSTDYRALYTQGPKVTYSATRRVGVMVNMTLQLSRRSVHPGRNVTITGAVSPAQADGFIKMTIKRDGQNLTRRVPLLNSRFTEKFTPRKTGRHTVVATYVPPSGQLTFLGNSARKGITVR